jgi:hypothetical protein
MRSHQILLSLNVKLQVGCAESMTPPPPPPRPRHKPPGCRRRCTSKQKALTARTPLTNPPAPRFRLPSSHAPVLSASPAPPGGRIAHQAAAVSRAHAPAHSVCERLRHHRRRHRACPPSPRAQPAACPARARLVLPLACAARFTPRTPGCCSAARASAFAAAATTARVYSANVVRGRTLTQPPRALPTNSGGQLRWDDGAE